MASSQWFSWPSPRALALLSLKVVSRAPILKAQRTNAPGRAEEP